MKDGEPIETGRASEHAGSASTPPSRSETPTPGKAPTLIERDLFGTGGAPASKIGHTSLVQQTFGAGDVSSTANGATIPDAMGFLRVPKPEAKPAAASAKSPVHATSRPVASPPVGAHGAEQREHAVTAATRGFSLLDIPIHSPDRHEPEAAPRTPGEAAFARATMGRPTELPNRSEMERTFGHDFRAVRTFADRGDALGPVGAHAAARGDTVAFASPSPDRSTVAHELTHVVQQRQSGMQSLAAKAESSPATRPSVKLTRSPAWSAREPRT